MIIKAEDFDTNILDKYNILKPNKNKKNSKKYLDVVTAFDIEATRLEDIEQAIMYIWQFQFDDITIIGRTWPEWFKLLERIAEHLQDVCYLVIYVHNLSYEFSFLKGWYDFESDEVFATDNRKVLKCTMFDCIEYRCSYFLSNMSLDKLLKKYNVENKKLTYDYNKKRFPWTKLDDQELNYCINDVKGLVQALKLQLKQDNDTLLTIPLTSTGYVRRDVKEAMKHYNHLQLKDMLPNVKVYKALREAFRGGDTLSNRWNTDEIVDNVKSADIVSSYIISLLRPLPMSKLVLEDPEDFNKLIKNKYKALLFRVIFIGIELKKSTEGHAYLSRDKCRDIEYGVYANGRVLQAEYLETTITDIDFKIIKKRYKWLDMKVFKLWSANYDYLPKEFRDVIIKYYRDKTYLKGSKEGSDDYYYYMKAKEKLNSCYGMCVEDIGKDRVEYKDGIFVNKDEKLKDIIDKNNKKAFLNYAWGIWVTALSREMLSDGIDVVTLNGKQPFNFVYSDTDSVKYIGNANFDEYNDKIKKIAISSGAVAQDKEGKAHYMGVYEDEDYEHPNRFKTLGAKKYVLEDKNKNLHITIAGVNKEKGAKELGKIENFQEGFIFKEAGGTESVFNDNVDMLINIDNHQLRIRDNVVIRDSTYTLGITAEYRAILDGLVDIKYSDHDIAGLYKVKN